MVASGLFALVSGCELLVPGSLSHVRCTEEGAIGPPVCPIGTFCLSGLCEDGPPGLGEPCGVEGACGPGATCLAPESIGFTGDPFCSAMCCSSADCGVGTGLVCATLGPGKVCVPAELWGRSRPGARFAGDACDTDGQCRSGQCSGKDGYCIDACCSDAECGLYGDVCRESGKGWTCQPDVAAHAQFPAPCTSDEDCASGVCVPWGDGPMRCAQPCCSSVECGKVKVGELVRNVLCAPVRHGTATVYACSVVADGDANRAIGEPCDSAGQCRGGLCIDTAAPGTPPGTGEGDSLAKVCSDVCCTDRSCGAPHLFACLPAGGGVAPGAPPGTGGQGFNLQCRGR